MKIYQSYEKGYREQQVTIKEMAQTLISEAITARLNAGKIAADKLAIYSAVMDDAESETAFAKKQYAEE